MRNNYKDIEYSVDKHFSLFFAIFSVYITGGDIMDFNQWLHDVRGISIYTYISMGSSDQDELYNEYLEWKESRNELH